MVKTNPAVMLAWAAIIAVLSLVALAPAFLGLIVVLPVLGHATWHLYRKGVGSPILKHGRAQADRAGQRGQQGKAGEDPGQVGKGGGHGGDMVGRGGFSRHRSSGPPASP